MYISFICKIQKIFNKNLLGKPIEETKEKVDNGNEPMGNTNIGVIIYKTKTTVSNIFKKKYVKMNNSADK